MTSEVWKLGRVNLALREDLSAQQNQRFRPTTDLQSSLSRAQIRSDSYAHALAYLFIDSA